MFQIVLGGTILTLIINSPLILYFVWSWRLLKRYSEDIASRQIWLRRIEVWLRLLGGSTIVSIVWPLVAGVLSFLAIFLEMAYSPNYNEDKRALAQFFLGIAYLP